MSTTTHFFIGSSCVFSLLLGLMFITPGVRLPSFGRGLLGYSLLILALILYLAFISNFYSYELPIRGIV